MASNRLLRSLYARTAGGTSWTLAPGGCSWTLAPGGCRRRVSSSPSSLQGCMSAWVIDQFGSNGALRCTDDIDMPTVKSPSDVIIKVNAASLNPLDVSMRAGYGAKLMRLRRNPFTVADTESEFPLILGRDLSGVVIDCGSEVTHFYPGDEVGASLQAHAFKDQPFRQRLACY